MNDVSCALQRFVSTGSDAHVPTGRPEGAGAFGSGQNLPAQRSPGRCARFHPDSRLKCLLIQPASEGSFWTSQKTCDVAGCKTVSPPLGLLTVAAILPQHWEFKLLDLNCREFDQELWDWADLVCTGGMLPQQPGIQDVVERGVRDGKFVVVGGPDPTSQPEIYHRAAARVLNEGEITVPAWLDSWRRGEPTGVFQTTEKPDVTGSPIPRYDLINFRDYLFVGLQISRGCPFNCEFCDIIELYGRQPRVKSPQQVVAELETLYRLGYQGQLDVVDDNFIGNKDYIKREILPAMIAWMKRRKYPFYLSTEASLNIADDEPLLAQMREAEFRYLFIGVETPDPDLLRAAQKPQNATRPISERIHKIYEYGMSVNAGFILGFDGERDGMDQSIIDLVEDTGIVLAMVGLLIALPNTQLSRRLREEGRLIGADGKSDLNEGCYRLDLSDTVFERCDQTTSGLNFVTHRDRDTILREYLNILNTVYSPDRFFRRVVRTYRRVKYDRHYFPRWPEWVRYLRGAVLLPWHLLFRRKTAWPYLRTVLCASTFGITGYVNAMKMVAMYLHFEEHLKYVNVCHPAALAGTGQRRGGGSPPARQTVEDRTAGGCSQVLTGFRGNRRAGGSGHTTRGSI